MEGFNNKGPAREKSGEQSAIEDHGILNYMYIYLYYYKNQGSMYVCHVYAGHLPIDGSASYFTQS